MEYTWTYLLSRLPIAFIIPTPALPALAATSTKGASMVIQSAQQPEILSNKQLTQVFSRGDHPMDQYH